MLLGAQRKLTGGICVMEGENIELRGPFAICNNRETWPFGQGTLVSFNEEELEWIMHVCPPLPFHPKLTACTIAEADLNNNTHSAQGRHWSELQLHSLRRMLVNNEA